MVALWIKRRWSDASRLRQNSAWSSRAISPHTLSNTAVAVSWDIDHDAQGFYSIDDSQQAILGERYFDGVFDRAARFLVTVDRPTMGSRESIRDWLSYTGNMDSSGRLVSSNAPSPSGERGWT